MARAATLPRLTWQSATLTQVRRESSTASTLRLDVAGWPGHRAGQHVDLRLTAADGYTAVRPYSLASAAGSGLVEITVATTPGGEVSTYLVNDAVAGNHVEVRGPLGSWFVWDASDPDPVQLVAGGSGVVPLMSMLRTHGSAGHPAPMRLLYSVSDPEQVLYADEVEQLAHAATVLHTRHSPPGTARPPGRVTPAEVEEHTLPATSRPSVFVCGPTGFVESMLTVLTGLGHDPDQIRAERYGERSSP